MDPLRPGALTATAETVRFHQETPVFDGTALPYALDEPCAERVSEGSVGVPITQPFPGLPVSRGFEYLLSGSRWISFHPGMALLVTVGSVNPVGDWRRDVLNPRLER